MKAVKPMIAILTCLFAVLLGLCVLVTAPVQGLDAPSTDFSAARAAQHLEVISKEVHTNSDTQAINSIRTYLTDTLGAMGLQVDVSTYEKDYEKPEHGYGSHVTAVDICGTLKGNSNRSILMVAHYDSNPGLGLGEAPGSHGASDDGYGVSVILETLRAVIARGQTQNTIRVVFTDAEETSMLGSEAIALDREYNAAASDAIFNIESRGLSGPSILFETSSNNAALIRFYAANNPHPASWSLATDVYRVMPNYTDFTAFIAQGMQGLNFSNLYKIEDNHTPRDVFENISISAIQDYGEQILSLVSAYAQGNVPNTFASNEDMAWFTLTRGIFIHFPVFMNWVWFALAAILLCFYVMLSHRKGKIKFRHLLRSFTYLGAALAVAALGTGLAMLLAKILGLEYSLTGLVGVPHFEWITVGLVLLLAIGLNVYGLCRMKKNDTYESLVVPAILLSVILAFVFTLFLPGGAFLFSLGAIFASILGIAALKLPSASMFTGFFAVLISSPVVALLLIALTPGALGVVLMFAAFPLFIAYPSLAAALYKPQGTGIGM